jgi:glycosyltransferase involved in cell wall biosynthesis
VHPKAQQELSGFCEAVHIIKISRLQLVLNLFKATLTGMPAQVGYFYSQRAQHEFNTIVAKAKPQHIYCQLIRTAPYVKHVTVPKTLDYMDVFSAGMLRRKQKAHKLLKPFFQLEYKRLLRYEALVFDWFQGHTIISVPDRDLIPHANRVQIEVVENGVDMGYFAPMITPKKHEVLFTGNMGYPPNINAAELLANEIMPLVRRKLPNASLVLAGANPHARVKSLADEFTTVTGWVDDMRPWYAGSRVFIAPMQIGTGLQNKLLEAMSMQLPCITSPLANNALGAAQGLQVMVGNSPAEYAAHIVELLMDESKAKQLALAGRQFVQQTFSWEYATQKLDALMA